MNKERAKELIKKLVKTINTYNQIVRDSEVAPPPEKTQVIVNENGVWVSEEMLQALDIAIESLETRYQMNNKGEITPLDNDWVDVRDRLPIKEEKYYLVDTDFGIEIMKWHENTLEKTSNGNGGFENVWEFESDDFEKQYLKEDKINAWRPLPQPYKRKE